MKLFKKISTFIALLLITLAFNSYTAEPSNTNGWLSYASSTLLNGYSGLKKLLTSATTPGTGFSDLPAEVQTVIIQLFAKSCADTTLKESAQTINALAQTSKHLNKLINDPQFNLELIKNRAKKFNVSDVKVAKTLHTKESDKRLLIQLGLAKIIKNSVTKQENEDVLTKLNKLVETGFGTKVKRKADVNFTYVWDQGATEYLSPLMYAVGANNKFFINYLLEHAANINQTAFNGKTALMYADSPEIITFLASKPNLNKDQQDSGGNTALLRAVQSYFPEDMEIEKIISR